MEGPAFYWGIGIENCWMAEHDEPNRSGKRLLDVFLQMQHYAMWREDLDRAAELGVNALRYSVPWYRANPRPGEYDWVWIGRSLEYLVGKLGIIPIIDLIHYGTPLWLENGVLNHEYPERIAEYASAFARQFKGLDSHYTPHNEPQISALFGGYRAYWPPYLVGVDGWTKVGLNVGRGMVLTSQALRAEVADATLISADCLAAPGSEEVCQKLGVEVTEPERDEFEYQVATFPACLAYGKVQPSTPFWAALNRAGYSDEHLAWFAANAQLPDIVGHNYIRPSRASTSRRWRPRGRISSRLSIAARFFDRPLYLTETSAGDTDEHKVAWMQAAYQTIARLKERGVAVVGMNWWPLFETVQWDYRDSAKTVAESITRAGWNNGLYLIEEQFDGTLARVRTGAADGYRDLIAAHLMG